MRKRIKHKRIINFILTASIALCATFYGFPQSLTVKATNVSEMESQIQEHESQIQEHESELESMEGQIATLTDEQDLVQEKIDDLNAEIINTMSSIGLKEAEIATKEEALEAKHNEVEAKQKDIDKTHKEYLEAKEREEKQYADMLVWIRCMYENSDLTYLAALLQGNGLADILNQMDYIEKVYEYGLNKLEKYEKNKILVKDLWHMLEIERALLAQQENSLKEDKEQLLIDQKALQVQKKNLDSMLERKKNESANYEAEINRYMQETLVMQELLQQEREELEVLQREQRKLEELQRLEEVHQRLEEQQQQLQQEEQQRQEETDASEAEDVVTEYNSIIDKAPGSTLGKKVAKYACQYIGNPYVYGGTSLTNGADCSGFVYRVYMDFGYSLPRTSYEQGSVGKSISLSDAQPGDLICYDGHVGIYIGDSKIVHASNSNPYPRGGIKVTHVDYRPVVSVRRVL